MTPIGAVLPQALYHFERLTGEGTATSLRLLTGTVKPCGGGVISQQLTHYYRRRNGGLGVGVADGVYMWKQQGIDSGLFSRSLMRYAKQALKDGVSNPVKGAGPLSGSSHGYQNTCIQPRLQPALQSAAP